MSNRGDDAVLWCSNHGPLIPMVFIGMFKGICKRKSRKTSLQPVSSHAALSCCIFRDVQWEQGCKPQVESNPQWGRTGVWGWDHSFVLKCPSRSLVPSHVSFCLAYSNSPSTSFLSSGLPSPSLPVWFHIYSELRICFRDAHPVNRSSRRTWSNLKPACALFLRFKQDFSGAQAWIPMRYLLFLVLCVLLLRCGHFK